MIVENKNPSRQPALRSSATPSPRGAAPKTPWELVFTKKFVYKNLF